MSKSVEDYRNIVKVLKLQLLKVRQQNSVLSHNLGINSQSEKSSFSTKLTKYKQSKHTFARNLLLLTNFAHRCEIIGVTPQMVFRICDKKRDKKVSVNNLTQIMKRLKLKLDEVQISRLCTLLTKSGQLHYQQYLQYLSAFQINSEKYPHKGKRTYTQICLLRFGQQCQTKGFSIDQLYKNVNVNERPALLFEDFQSFVVKNNFKLKQIQVVGVFVGLDIQSDCQVVKQVFIREMGKVYSLVQKGITADKDIEQIERELQMQRQRQIIIKNKTKHKHANDEDQIEIAEQTGVQAGNKQKKAPKKPTNQVVKLDKGDFGKVLGQLKKQNIRVDNLIAKILEKQEKKQLIKPFSLLDFQKAIKQINNDFNKKKIIIFFKYLDTGSNGSVSSQELLKLWLRSIEVTSSIQVMYKLLFRHFKQTSFKQPLSKFSNLGYKKQSKLTENIFSDVFSAMNLSTQEIKLVMSHIRQVTIQKFCQLLKTEGKKKSAKVFKQMDKSKYDTLNKQIKKITSKIKQQKNFVKKIRLLEKQQKVKAYWDTIFTNEWKCWQYCLQTASKLTTYWRDHEFGPTKGDPHGYRSIVGNESDIPPGLPDEQDIQWLTFQQILAKQKDYNSEVVFMEKDLQTTDVVQGKLGDCWYVSSLSIIAKDDTYIKGKEAKACRKNPQLLTYGIHPWMFQYFTQFGIYVFKFFKQFKPVYVVVDQLFPVEVSSLQLIFAKSPDQGLQWVAFLEKAYAKLHHSYSNMISGDISQGLNDLTNALPIKQSLSSQTEMVDEWKQKLRKLTNQQQLMGCSITAPKGGGVEKPVELDGERCGLFYGHAYSISDFFHLDASKRDQDIQFDLIRIRNPWGHGQWCLDWSQKPLDDNAQYKKLNLYMKDIQNHYKKVKQQKRYTEIEEYKIADDGEFLMNFNDWIKIYNNLFTGYSFKEDQEYRCQFIEEMWNPKTPSGICKMKGSTQEQQRQFIKNNHQYVLELRQQTDILMLLIQEDGRLFRGQKYPYKQLCNGVIILVFSLDKNQPSVDSFKKEKLLSTNLKFQLRREVDFWRKMKPGRYAIIPCKMKNEIQNSKFQFRLYSSKDVSIKKIRNGNQIFRALPKIVKSEGDPAVISTIIDEIQQK